MVETSPKESFDQAYSHLKSGEIKEATACFQYVVRNPHIFGPYAAMIAQQRILWYCVPLDMIFAEMEQYKFPVDIYSIISLLGSDARYTETVFEEILKLIEDHLTKMPVCIRVGKYFWVYQTVIVELARHVALDMVNATAPVSLEAIFRKEWPDFCRDHPTFPDHFSEFALAGTLQNFHIKVLTGKFVISEKLLHTAIDAFAQMISQAGHPLCLNNQILQLFPSLSASPEAISILENSLPLNLDNRFIAYIPGCYLTQPLLQFDTISFDDLFSNEYLPLPTKSLLKHRFPDLDLTHLNPNINTLVQSQLLKNPYLVQIGDGTWFSHTRFDVFHSQVIQALSDQDGAISLDDLLKPIAPSGMQPNHLYLFQEVILPGLREDNQAIPVTQTHWLHRGKITDLIDKAYNYLLVVTQAPIEKIVPAILSNLDLTTPKRGFYDTFEDYLRKDPRFSLVSNNRKVWRAIPQMQRNNDIIYKLLSELKFPLTEDEIVDKLQLIDPKYDLAADSRFQSFPNDRWGLSFWVWLNDYAYEFLLHTRQSLHENVVVGLVCKEHGFHRRFAIFLPGGDPRFAKDALNRWFCRYQLKPADLDRLLVELDQYAGVGRKLEVLFQKVLRLHPDATNAGEVLPSDPRFIHLDDLWYSHRKAFRELSSADVEKIYTYFSELPADSPAISIKNIGLNALGWDGRLTNAPDMLTQDNRFVEKHQDFWVLSTWSSPDYDRTSYGGAAVFGSTSITGYEDDLPVELPAMLTKRGHRGGNKPSQDVEQKRVYHTLSHLDILHGNIRISGLLKKWIPKTAETILLVDNESNEMVAYVDETHIILNIRDWIQARELTYGDKIYIQSGSQPANFYIRPYGKRDQRIYQEALQHQDIEKLITEARRVNMTYHDLMIEVMESFCIPLHREDIFQLVDYRRTAARNTIFEILSLTDCPYEELRYFVPEGKGLWSFDRQRKKAYDMEIKELLDENALLKSQIALLSERKENEQDITDRFSQLKQKVQSLEQSIQALNTEKTSLSARIPVLEAEKSQVDQLNDQLNKNLTQAQQLLTEITTAQAGTSAELERLRLEQQAFQQKEYQFQAAQTELEHLRLELKAFQAKAPKLVAMQAELNQSRQLLAQIQAESTQQVANLQERIAGQLASEQAEKQAVQAQLDQTCQQFQVSQAQAAQESAALSAQVQKLAAELEARAIAIQSLETQLVSVNTEEATIKEDSPAEQAQLTQQLLTLQNQLDTLSQTHAHQTQDLAALTARLKQIDRALATPLGRLFAWLQDLK